MPPQPEPIAPVPVAPPASAAGIPPVAGANAIDPKKLTPEEQMALFEKDLKENDWGHQPC
jgi:hypothetical protein